MKNKNVSILILEDEIPAYQKLINYLNDFFDDNYSHDLARSIEDGKKHIEKVELALQQKRRDKLQEEKQKKLDAFLAKRVFRHLCEIRREGRKRRRRREHVRSYITDRTWNPLG